MNHTLHRLPFLILVAILALPAATPDWFPLEIGNTWLYRPRAANRINPDFRSIRVHGRQTIADRDYFDVSYFGREVLLRVESATGNVLVYDRTSNSEKTWMPLGAALGASFSTEVNPCPTRGTIAARDAAVTVPAGEFSGTVQVKFAGNCVDVGAIQQFYAPDVGLVSSEEETIAGPVLYELTYYRLGSRTGAAPEVSFTLALDAPRYPVGGTLAARLTLRSSSPDAIPLHFPGGQSYELKILNDKGDVVFLWSKGRAFTTIVRDEAFGPGEETFGLTASLADLPVGRYKAEAWLTTDPVMYRANIGFEIVSNQLPTPPRRRHR